MSDNVLGIGHEPDYFQGVDFANGRARFGRCYLIDNGESLMVAMDKPRQGRLVRSAIDCPLGTTSEFEKLLAGDLPPYQKGGFKSRATEEWLRKEIQKYRTTGIWKDRTKGKKKPDQNPKYRGVTYFNRSGHIKPTIDMAIVPECLWWLGDQISAGCTTQERLDALVAARKGDGPMVEAHPRMFLYSLVERVYRDNPAHVDLEVLYSNAKYKSDPALRHLLFQLMREQSAKWTGETKRAILPEDIPDCLAISDHMFDAFLCTLTAWAHEHGECVTWKQAEIGEEVVSVEGHILVLRQTE